MKKYFNYIKSMVFIAFFLFFIFIGSILLFPKDNTKKCGMQDVVSNGFLGEKENSLDVLYIGDSESYASFSPMQMYDEHGFTGYVLGASAQRIYNQYYYLKEALKNQSPKVVVIETNTLFRKYSVLKAVLGELNNSIPFFKYHNRWKKFSFNDLKLKKDYTHTEVAKGFRIRKMVESADNSDYMKNLGEVVEVPYLNEYYVGKIKELCQEKGIEVILVSTESLANMSYARHIGLQKMADRLELPYLDLNLVDEIEIDWQVDTADKGDHLNASGAYKVSKYMGKYLKEKYKLKSHKSDFKYKKWDYDLEEYKKLVS